MDSIYNKSYGTKKMNKTLWVGNLHPNVSYKILAELFYQVGPIEYIEFAVDVHKMHENYALIVFKHQCSLEDSIRLFCATKLYGWPIITKNCSKQIKNPDCHDQQKYNHVDKIDSSSKSINNNRNRLTIYPTLDVRNTNSNENRLDNMPIQSYIDKSSKYQHNTYTKNLFYISEHPLGKYEQSHKNYRKSIYSNNNSMHISNNDQDSYNNRSCNRKSQHYNINTSLNRNKSTYYHDQEHFFINRNNFIIKDRAQMCDLKNILYKKNTIS